MYHGLVLIPYINKIENSVLDLVVQKYKDQILVSILKNLILVWIWFLLLKTNGSYLPKCVPIKN